METNGVEIGGKSFSVSRCLRKMMMMMLVAMILIIIEWNGNINFSSILLQNSTFCLL